MVPPLDMKPVNAARNDNNKPKEPVRAEKRVRSPVRAYINRKAPAVAVKSASEEEIKVIPKR